MKNIMLRAAFFSLQWSFTNAKCELRHNFQLRTHFSEHKPTLWCVVGHVKEITSSALQVFVKKDGDNQERQLFHIIFTLNATSVFKKRF